MAPQVAQVGPLNADLCVGEVVGVSIEGSAEDLEVAWPGEQAEKHRDSVAFLTIEHPERAGRGKRTGDWSRRHGTIFANRCHNEISATGIRRYGTPRALGTCRSCRISGVAVGCAIRAFEAVFVGRSLTGRSGS